MVHISASGRTGSGSVAELVHEGLMEVPEPRDHRLDLFLAGQDGAPDMTCPGGPVAPGDLVGNKKDQRPKVRQPYHAQRNDLRSQAFPS